MKKAFNKAQDKPPIGFGGLSLFLILFVLPKIQSGAKRK